MSKGDNGIKTKVKLYDNNFENKAQFEMTFLNDENMPLFSVNLTDWEAFELAMRLLTYFENGPMMRMKESET